MIGTNEYEYRTEKNYDGFCISLIYMRENMNGYYSWKEEDNDDYVFSFSSSVMTEISLLQKSPWLQKTDGQGTVE